MQRLFYRSQKKVVFAFERGEREEGEASAMADGWSVAGEQGALPHRSGKARVPSDDGQDVATVNHVLSSKRVSTIVRLNYDGKA
jgi:hypothetical protein